MEEFRGLMLRYMMAVGLVALSTGGSAQAIHALTQTPLRMTPAVASSASGPTSGAPNAMVISRDSLREQARNWVGLQTGADPALVSVGALDGRVEPPACENGYRFDFPFESRTTVRATCDRPARQYYMRANVERPRQRLVLTRPMSAGEIVVSSDLTVRDTASAGGGLDNPSHVVGRALRRALPAGEVLQAQDLEETVAVLHAARELRSGETLPSSAFRIEQVPRGRAPLGALTRSDDLSRARLRRDVPTDRVLVADDLTDTRRVVIARRNLMRGETIDGSALEVVEMDRRALPADHLSSPQGLNQAEATGMIRAGEPLRASMFRPALMVRKGQAVVLTVARTGIEISVQVESLEDARFGDQVKLRNPDSGKSLSGVVTGRGAARAL